MQTIRLLILTILLVTAGSAWCKEYRIGVLYRFSNIPGQVAMSKGLEDETRRVNPVVVLPD